MIETAILPGAALAPPRPLPWIRMTLTTATSAHTTQTYRERLPAPSLTADVACVWIHQVSEAGPAYEHRTVPNGCVEISCAIGEDVITVVGPRRTPVVERLEPGTTVVGVRFRPGAARASLGTPASELVDLRADLDCLWGSSSAALAERIAEATFPEHGATLLENAIAARTADRPIRDPLVAAVLDLLLRRRPMPIGELTSELLLSSRQLRRRCITGLTPKRFLDETRKSCGSNHDHAASFAPLRRLLLSNQPS